MPEVMIKDVADFAGVHRTTASKILNNDPLCKVASATRRRVLEAAESLGFKRNDGFDVPQEVHNIALMGMDGSYREENPFYYDVFEGVNCKAQNSKLNLYLLNDLTRISLMHLVKQKTFWGLISVGGIPDSIVLALEMAHKPLVVVESAQNFSSSVLYTVKTDSTLATYNTTKYLLNCGHRHIYYIGYTTADGRECPKSFERFNGVAKALRDAGLYHDQVRFQAAMKAGCGGEIYAATDVGQRSMEMLLATKPPKPFACVCYSDLHALGAYRAAQNAGLRIPEDVSFTGYDDIPIAAKMDPPLTTTRVPRTELGTLAVQTIIDYQTNSPKHVQVLESEFMERNSVLKLR